MSMPISSVTWHRSQRTGRSKAGRPSSLDFWRRRPARTPGALVHNAQDQPSQFLEPEATLVMTHTAEGIRLEEARQRTKHWKRWGPYVSERAWGSVREDYSQDGEAWD